MGPLGFFPVWLVGRGFGFSGIIPKVLLLCKGPLDPGWRSRGVFFARHLYFFCSWFCHWFSPAPPVLVRQLRGPHLSTCPWCSSRSSIAETAALSPSSLPQSSTGLFDVISVLVLS